MNSLNRRQFITTTIAAAALLPHAARPAEPSKARHLPARLVSALDLPLTNRQRAPFGWRVVTVSGAKHGWLDDQANTAARKTLAGLQPHLTPDGFLGGVSQSNKGGEGLQRSDYHSLYQMGMGLMAQLLAALEVE